MRKTALETYLKGRFKVWVLVASRSEPSEHGTVSEARTGVGGGGGAFSASLTAVSSHLYFWTDHHAKVLLLFKACHSHPTTSYKD